jgi:hypothetical protein
MLRNGHLKKLIKKGQRYSGIDKLLITNYSLLIHSPATSTPAQLTNLLLLTHPRFALARSCRAMGAQARLKITNY